MVYDPERRRKFIGSMPLIITTDVRIVHMRHDSPLGIDEHEMCGLLVCHELAGKFVAVPCRQ